MPRHNKNIKDIIKKANKVAAHKAKMDSFLNEMTPDSREAAKQYISKKEIPQLFESITAGMLHHRPENPVEFLQECLDKVSQSESRPHWDTFINFEPSEKCRNPPMSSTVSSPLKTSATTRASSGQSANTSNNASYTPAPISAHPSNRPSKSPAAIQSFP